MIFCFPVLRNEPRVHTPQMCEDVAEVISDAERFLAAMKQVQWRTDTPRCITLLQAPAPKCVFSTNIKIPDFIPMNSVPTKGVLRPVRASYLCTKSAIGKLNGLYACLVHSEAGGDLVTEKPLGDTRSSAQKIFEEAY